MRKALVLGISLLVASVVLGGTVFRQQVAEAASMLSVFVTNDASHPVPVREQNVDANGNVKVHEQGRAAVTDVTSPAREAVLYTHSETDIVPAGQRFIATWVNVRVQSFSGDAAIGCTIEGRNGGTTTNIGILRLLPAGNSTYGDNEQVFIPVNSGESLAIAGCSGFASNLLIAIGGYFTATG
jgi:hypothetical protein